MMAKHLGSPAFSPHLTILGDLQATLSEAETLARKILPTVPHVVQIAGPETSSAYFMACYLGVKTSPSFEEARRVLHDEIHGVDHAMDPPHISLAYGLYDQEKLSPYLKPIDTRYCGKTASVSSIEIVKSAKTIPIEDWKTVHKIKLR